MSGIAEDTAGYDKIADLIGSTIDTAFQDLLKKLVEERDFSSITLDGVSITQADLDNFLTITGGADIAINFTPKLLKGTVVKYSATPIKGTASSGLLGGEITIGGRWTF